MLGTRWSYSTALLYKCDECFFEAGLQLILQTYIQKTKHWKLYEHALVNPIPKGYYLQENGELIAEGMKVF